MKQRGAVALGTSKTQNDTKSIDPSTVQAIGFWFICLLVIGALTSMVNYLKTKSSTFSTLIESGDHIMGFIIGIPIGLAIVAMGLVAGWTSLVLITDGISGKLQSPMQNFLLACLMLVLSVVLVPTGICIIAILFGWVPGL